MSNGWPDPALEVSRIYAERKALMEAYNEAEELHRQQIGFEPVGNRQSRRKQAAQARRNKP